MARRPFSTFRLLRRTVSALAFAILLDALRKSARKRAFLTFLTLLALPAAGQDFGQRVIVISVDGLRPDVIVDFMAASIGLVGLRIGYRAFRSVLGIQQRRGTRVLLYGAGQGGEFAVREMRMNPAHRMNPVGFLDDDPVKKDSRNYGLRIWGGFVALEQAIRSTRAEQVVICSSKIPEDRAIVISRTCQALGIPCSRMRFSFDEQLGNPPEKQEDKRESTPDEPQVLELIDL